MVLFFVFWRDSNNTCVKLLTLQQGKVLLYFSATTYFEIYKKIKLQGGNSLHILPSPPPNFSCDWMEICNLMFEAFPLPKSLPLERGTLSIYTIYHSGSTKGAPPSSILHQSWVFCANTEVVTFYWWYSASKKKNIQLGGGLCVHK